MDKKILLLFLVIITILIPMIFLCSNFKPKESGKKPIICGDDICEESEASYCLDCNLSCKSELCNPEINIICDGCAETQKRLLSTLFGHQTIAYDCLSNYYGYHPPRIVYHTIVHSDVVESCLKKEGCYISGGGYGGREGIRQGFVPGLREYGESDVTKRENVGFEIHELAHSFTSYGLGVVPVWFDEGISIYTESRVLCHSDYILSSKIDNFKETYKMLNAGDITLDKAAPYDEYYKVKHNAHAIGAMYFGALEKDYNCGKDCIAKILYSLHQYRENCTGVCFENAKSLMPQLANISLNNNDLRIPVITNKIIKEKSEERVYEDLTDLFNLLEINYSK